VELKVCSKCEIEKTLDNFRVKFNKKQAKYYRNSYCRGCERKYSRVYHTEYRKAELCYKKQYRESHKNEIKEYMKEYRRNNKKYINKCNRQWRKNNPECNKEYYKNNKSKIYANQAKRRATKRNQIPTNANKEKISYMYQIAHELTEERGVEYQVDHIKPLSKGGLHHENNLQILSRSLNLKKASKWPLTKEENVLYAGVTIKDLKMEEAIQ